MTENNKQLIKKDNELAKKIIISEQEKKKLEEMSKLKSQIVANVSHELRTPLTSIKESFSIVHDGFVGEITKEQKEILETGIRNTKRLIRMVSNLLDVSRIESGKIKVTKKTFELFSFINDLIQTQVKDALKKEITIQKNIFENIGSITTDRDLLSEIFLNILNNAIKYSPPKSEVIINIEEINNEFRFEIADNGAGISKEDLEKIFTRYERLTSTKEEGTGLGLSITKQLINLLHGKIRVESEIGKGSKFIFTLPKNID